MSDEAYLESRRRWEKTRLVSDEAAFLAQSVRSGLLSQRGLELAGWLQYPAALGVVGRVRPPATIDERLEIGRWGRRACLHAILTSSELSEFARTVRSSKRFHTDQLLVTHGLGPDSGWAIITCCSASRDRNLSEAREFAAHQARMSLIDCGGVSWRVKNLVTETGCPVALMAADLASAAKEWTKITGSEASYWRGVDRSRLADHTHTSLLSWALGRCCEFPVSLDPTIAS